MWGRFRSDESGFTLVETLAVLVIVAILTAVAMPTMAGSIEKAKKYRYLEETRKAAEAVQYLAIQENAAGTFDFFEFAAEIHQSLDSKDNRVALLLEGDVTPGARIEEISMDSDQMKLTSITYLVKSHRIVLNLEKNTVVFR